MNNYLQPLNKLFQSQANAAEAAKMKAYLKDRFDFFGIKTNLRRQLCESFLKDYGLPDGKSLQPLVTELFSLPQREYHHFAMELVVKFKKTWNEEHLKLMEEMILSKSWWDTVDFIAVHGAGNYFLRHADETLKYIKKWNNAANMWLNRSSIIFQNNLKSKTDASLLFDNIKKHTGSDEFFIQKAIGWALRQYAATDAEAVRKFCSQTELKPLSRREALRKISK